MPRVILMGLLIAAAPAFGASAAHNPMLGLPALPAGVSGAAEPLRARLGKKLFFDPRLSADGKISCSSCHRAESAFSDGRTRSKGHDGLEGTRNAPTLMNVAYVRELFWDGRSADLSAQARAPLLNPVEHALADDAAVERIVREDPEYVAEFQAAYNVSPHDITLDRIVDALVTYERTLRAGNSAFDRYQYGADAKALSDSALRGLALFRGRAQCSSCHSIDTSSALFTDGGFHVGPTGLPQEVTAKLAVLARKVLEARTAGSAALEQLIATDAQIAALGRFVATQDPRDIGKFRTPSLRNVALTAPYMHDGGVPTLEKAIDLELYGRSTAVRYPIVLTLAERADLLEFLRALTSEAR